ncbi:transposase [Streptomyces chartreusis]|uniref:transposase n=1 Tax=Streptomyces chartreusis TaxID=1969 RepID=UPI00380CF285
MTTLVDTTVMSAHVRRVLTEMITEIDGLKQRVRGLENTSRDRVTPLAPALVEITGISHVSAAVLLTEIGDTTLSTSSAKPARYTRAAPIPVYSSDKKRHRLHRGGNPDCAVEKRKSSSGRLRHQHEHRA